MSRLTPRGHTEADREYLMSVTGRISLEQAHDALTSENVKRELHGAQDDVGEWAHAHWESLRAGLADRRLAEQAEQERHDRVLAESISHFRACRGISCKQHRLPCRENCPPAIEMACTAGEDPLPLPWWATDIALRVALAALGGLLVWLCWMAPLGN